MARFTAKPSEVEKLNDILCELLNGLRVHVTLNDGRSISGSVVEKHFGNDYNKHHNKMLTKYYGEIVVRDNQNTRNTIDCLDIEGIQVHPFEK